MTDESISLLLDRLNKDDREGIIIRPISERVWWGCVWDAMEEGQAADCCALRENCEFYFIKSQEGVFAAALHRFGPEEMHWFVAESHRRKGILLEPLKTVILPHIFWNNKNAEFQKGTVGLLREWADYSSRLAEKVGLKKIAVNEAKQEAVFEIKRSDVPAYTPFAFTIEVVEGMEELEDLKLQVAKSIRSLLMAHDSLKIRYAKAISSDKLKDISNEVFGLKWAFFDAIKYDAPRHLGRKTQ